MSLAKTTTGSTDTTTTIDETAPVERIHVHRETVKRLGHWTTAGAVEVRLRTGGLVLDLRSPQLPEQVEIRVDAQNGVLKLLLGERDVLEHWDLGWTGRGGLKDATAPKAPAPGGRRIVLTGSVEHGEVRVHRGGVAVVSAMLSREYVNELRAARKSGKYPTIDDPTRA